MPVAGSQGGQEAGQESGDFAESGEGDGLPWPAAVLRGSLRHISLLAAGTVCPAATAETQ